MWSTPQIHRNMRPVSRITLNPPYDCAVLAPYSAFMCLMKFYCVILGRPARPITTSLPKVSQKKIRAPGVLERERQRHRQNGTYVKLLGQKFFTR